jgi:hypothetical protein
MKKVPYLAKERILQQLHPAFLAKPRPKAKAAPKAPIPE